MTSSSRGTTPQHQGNQDSEEPASSGSDGLSFVRELTPPRRYGEQLLTLESYKSLPVAPRLPDLSDIDEEKTPLQSLSGPPPLTENKRSPERTPYQVSLFDVRIEGYLRECSAAAHDVLLTPSEKK